VKPAWTRKLPRKKGYYWVGSIRGYFGAIIVKVEKRDGRWWMWSLEGLRQGIIKVADFKWSGPLVPPK
jgi:hypothetical protein